MPSDPPEYAPSVSKLHWARAASLQTYKDFVCHASLIPRYEWLPAFDDSRRTPNKKEFTNASLTVPPEQQMARVHVRWSRADTAPPGRVAEPEVPDKRAAGGEQ